MADAWATDSVLNVKVRDIGSCRISVIIYSGHPHDGMVRLWKVLLSIYPLHTIAVEASMDAQKQCRR